MSKPFKAFALKTNRAIPNRYPPDRTIHSVSLYILSYQFPMGNHRLTELQYMLKYHPPIISTLVAAVVSLCHNRYRTLQQMYMMYCCPQRTTLSTFTESVWTEIVSWTWQTPIMGIRSRGHFDLLILILPIGLIGESYSFIGMSWNTTHW